MAENATSPDLDIRFRAPTPEDGARMWSLIGEMGGLEQNTAYFYVLFCLDFTDTCIVAEADGRMAGFVLGYRPPARPDAMFVWQVGVAPWARRQRLAQRMIRALLDELGVTWLEATVTPDNEPSRKLFRSMAREYDTECQEIGFMTAEMFPKSHEPEDLFRIGPLKKQ